VLETSGLAIVLVLLAAILGAVGQFLFKSGSQNVHSLVSFFLNFKVLAGMACYLTVMAFFTHAFKLGGSVRVLYPIYASTFIWAALFALFLYHQPVRPIHIAGMVLLISGIILMSW
jgi:multidrug transporter EmrE-like cation transporter